MFSGRCKIFIFHVSCHDFMIFLMCFFFSLHFIYGTKDWNRSKTMDGFCWFDHRSSSSLMKVKCVARKAKSHRYWIWFLLIFVAEKSDFIAIIIWVDDIRERKNIENPEIFILLWHIVQRRQKHVNRCGPPIWLRNKSAGGELYECEWIWSLAVCVCDTSNATRFSGERSSEESVKHGFSSFMFDLVSHLLLWHSN